MDVYFPLIRLCARLRYIGSRGYCVPDSSQLSDLARLKTWSSRCEGEGGDENAEDPILIQDCTHVVR